MAKTHAACGYSHDSSASCPPFTPVPFEPPPDDPPEQPDMVNHPPHYTASPGGVECITVTEWMTFNQGNAVKYLWRCYEKGDPIENLEKARWYVDREIARLRGMA